MKENEKAIFEILLITLGAGLAIPLGGWLSYFEKLRNSRFLERIRPFSNALGGGLLLSAVCLALIPKGLEHSGKLQVAISFLAGGIVFYYIDKKLESNGGSAAQFVATLLDFIPESIALGALYLRSPKVALFLGLIIALQNIPEGFNAFADLTRKNFRLSKKYLLLFLAVAFLGPIAGAIGFYLLAQREAYLSFIMIFSAAGIIYLIFQDIAPESKVKHRWTPALGAILGFFIGLIGHLFI